MPAWQGGAGERVEARRGVGACGGLHPQPVDRLADAASKRAAAAAAPGDQYWMGASSPSAGAGSCAGIVGVEGQAGGLGTLTSRTPPRPGRTGRWRTIPDTTLWRRDLPLAPPAAEPSSSCAAALSSKIYRTCVRNLRRYAGVQVAIETPGCGPETMNVVWRRQVMMRWPCHTQEKTFVAHRLHTQLRFCLFTTLPPRSGNGPLAHARSL